MITKDFFVKTMEKLCEQERAMDHLDRVVRSLGTEGFCSFYWVEPISVAIDVMARAMGDGENGWLSYLVWEKDWLRDYRIGNITINGEDIELRDWGDVYEFLREEANELAISAGNKEKVSIEMEE